MADFDFITLIVPTILAAVVSFIILGINKLGKTSEGTLTGTIRLEHVQTNLDGLESKMDKGFEKIESLLNEQEKENRMAFNKVWTRFEELHADIKLHEYRLNQMDRQASRQGDEKAAV